LKWNEGEAAYKKALELDPDNALALQGLSTIYRRRGDNERTADAAMRAVSLLFRLPVAHFNLGVALARSGETERAEFAFKTALRFQPEMLNAHRFLAFLYRSMNKLEEARFHRGEVARLTQASSKRRREAKKYEDRKFDLPPIPSQAERRETLLRERPVPKPQDQEKSGKTFVLVSGLPRSGTSLMMQMLEAGGLKILTDRERAADVDNPKGYYEWEPIKQIAKKPELLDSDDLNGHVIKCISMLLPSLPPKHDYKVIFMVRPIEQVIASQKKMTTRLGTKGAELEREQLERGMHAHRNEALSWLKRTPNFELLTVDYPDLVRDPQSIIPQLVTFLGEERLTSSEKMAQVIDPALHRRREKTE
jgi:tetratricopeptide (TPR) repeat protein